MKQLILNISKEIHKIHERAKFIMLSGLQLSCGLLAWALVLYFISQVSINHNTFYLGRALTECAVFIAAESLIFGFVADLLFKRSV